MNIPCVLVVFQCNSTLIVTGSHLVSNANNRAVLALQCIGGQEIKVFAPRKRIFQLRKKVAQSLTQSIAMGVPQTLPKLSYKFIDVHYIGYVQ